MMILEDRLLGWYNCGGLCQPHLIEPHQLSEAQVPIQALGLSCPFRSQLLQLAMAMP